MSYLTLSFHFNSFILFKYAYCICQYLCFLTFGYFVIQTIVLYLIVQPICLGSSFSGSDSIDKSKSIKQNKNKRMVTDFTLVGHADQPCIASQLLSPPHRSWRTPCSRGRNLVCNTLLKIDHLLFALLYAFRGTLMDLN